MKKLLKEYQNFKNSYNFEFKELIKTENGLFFDKELIEDNLNNKVFEGDNFINIFYGSKTSIAKVLSNLYPYKFKFKGKKVSSIEGVLQGIKYKDKKTENLVFSYYGLDAYHTRACNNFDFWGNTGKLYFKGKEIDRHSKDYQNFLDELYLSLLKNKLFQRALISSGNKYLLHHIGQNDPNITVLTRFEYESRLNTIRAFYLNKLSKGKNISK